MRQDRIAIALLALLIVAAFANVIFDGRSLVASDNLNPLWPDFSSPAEWQRPDLVAYPNYRDITSAIMQSDPSREFLRRSLVRGEFPFWDPYLGGGGPSFGSMWPAYLFPPSLLVVLLGNGSLIRNAYILLLILCSGTLTYYFLRLHALRWPAALAGAIAFAFSGAVIQTTPSVIGQPVAFFSLPLLATALLIERPDARRAAQAALAFAFVALASFPPVLLQIFGMSAVYAVVKIFTKSKERARTVAWFAGAAAISLTIASVVYLPGWKVMTEMSHVREYYSHAAEDTMAVNQLGQALSPTIMGGVPIYAHPAVMGSMGNHLYYSGIVALFLAGIGVVAGGGTAVRILRITASLCGVLALAKIIGLPPVQWIAFVPLLRSFHYAAYLGILIAYATAILAALGIDALLAGRARAWHVAAGASIPVLGLVAVRIQAWRRGVALHSEGWRWLADFRLLIVFCVLAVIAGWLAYRSPRVRTVAVIFAIVLLGAEGVRNSSYPRPRRGDVWTHPPRYVEVLAEKNSGGRVLPLPVYPANTESVFRQPTLDAILSASTRMHSLYNRYFGPIPDPILREAKRIPPERVLDVANIEYIAIASSDERHVAEAMKRGYEPLYIDALVHVIRRRADPRYSFTSSYQMAKSEGEALAALETLPRGSVLLETPPSFPSAAGQTADVQPRLTKFSLNEVELIVRTPRPGLLVCSESNMAGWKATIDRRPARILAANYAFRAIEVPRGAHTIHLTYYPPGFTGGLSLAFFGLLACGWGLRSTSASEGHKGE